MAIRDATPIVLTAEERHRLEGWVRSSTTEQRLVERARVVLLAAAGLGSRAIGRELGCARGVGLDLAPPDHAIVLAVDACPVRAGLGPRSPTRPGKPAIQALERAQGYLKLPHGRSLHGQAHESKRCGNSTLFTALEVATGQIRAKHTKRRRRVEFLGFMNEVVADYPDQQIHVVLDNLSTHKPKRDQWLARHPNVHFHFTPTHASWLNQVEICFSILARTTLEGASLSSVAQLRAAIDAFIVAYNAAATPFQWRQATVRPKGLTPRITDLRS
jgi:transposase